MSPYPVATLQHLVVQRYSGIASIPDQLPTFSCSSLVLIRQKYQMWNHDSLGEWIRREIRCFWTSPLLNSQTLLSTTVPWGPQWRKLANCLTKTDMTWHEMTYITPYSSSINSAQNLSNSINTYIFIINISIYYDSINSHYFKHQFLHSCVCKVTEPLQEPRSTSES